MAKKKSEEPIIDYFRDNALTGKKEDAFEHQHYVSVLKDILLKSQTPINIGLYGKWGVGKSSIVHMLKEEIENDKELKDFEYVEVDAWGISGKSLQQGILEEINSNLGFPYTQEELEDTLYNIQQVDTIEFRNLFRSYWWIWAIIAGSSIPLLLHAKDDIVSALSILGFASIIGVLVPLSRLFFSSSKRIIPRAVSTFQFNKIYEKIIQKRKKKLVVVIDNLDRCEDTVAVELLGIIQTFMVRENCINILACDDEAIVTHLKNVKRNYTDKDGNEFLSKFFQVTIRIPPFIGENLSSYTDKLMKKRSVKFNPFVKPILISGAIENPRKINQFLNIAVALYRLAEFKENAGKIQKDSITGNTNFLMKIIVIRHEWPEFYKSLENSPDLLNDKEKFDVWCNQQMGKQHVKNDEIERLKKFLNATRTSRVNDIRPFLRLNQESYDSESGIGKFEDAFITLDSKAVNIFKDLDDNKQEQYLNKIGAIMKKYESDPEKLVLVNCALSLIDIIPHISDIDHRVTALGTLGQYMSSELLEHLDKFDIEQLGLFGILEAMIPYLSAPIYDELISGALDKELDADLIEKFFKNGDLIRTQILDQVDSKFAHALLPEATPHVELLTTCIKNYNWSENNITKPSKIVQAILGNITFDETPINITYSDLYENIKDSLVDEERALFYELLEMKIDECVKIKSALSPRLLAHLISDPIDSFEIASHEKQNIFASLCDLIEFNPDLPQNEEILKMVISLYAKIKELSETIIDYEKYIEESFVHYVKRVDAPMLNNMLSKPEYREFLKKDKIIDSLLEKYVELGSNVPEIIRYFLKTTSYSTEKIILSKAEEMISSRDVLRFQTLLAVAKENDPEINSDLVQKIGNMCLKEAEDNENTTRYSMYEHAIELNLGSFDRSKVSDYAIDLIQNEDPPTQEQGFSLLRKFNSIYSDGTEPMGVTNAIKIATELIKNNSERVIQYIGFIYEFKGRFTYSHRHSLIDLFRIGLGSGATENILNNVTEYLKRSSEDIVVEVFDEIIDFADTTSYSNAKEQCKQIFITHKEKLRDRHKDLIKKIFPDIVFD